jgi:hypothetical protein
MEISTGTAESHPTPLPLDTSATPGVQQPTTVAGQLTPADQGGVRDLTGERLGQLAGYEQDITAAQAAGMSAENGRRQHYGQDILPTGSSYGDPVTLPPAPAYTLPPPPIAGYEFSGDEPVTA